MLIPSGTLQTSVDSLEKIQSIAVRFIRNLKGHESVTEAKALLGLVPPADRRKNHRVSLLMRILQDNQHHDTLSSGYDEIVNDGDSRCEPW